MNPLTWFKTGADQPVIADAARVRAIYESKRRGVFWTLVIGYSFFYVCRLTLSVAKKPMIDAGVVDAEELGRIGAALLLTYAVGKFVNGFLADRANIARLMATGLLVSAGVVFAFGFAWPVPVLIALWAVNGWFQSMGAAPSGASIAQWFSNRERGTRYSIWSTAHSIGEGMTFAVTATIVAHYGYRHG
ncbi:MAG TPA: MFS transporter, partial [Candidatus Hydrogenedentes bacterium]|nr:MFS transporter [Candidatus Hydrogenedentota bacterium]